MSTTIYTAKLPWGEALKISADLSQASAPISYQDGKEWISTPFQTADARHDASNAVRLILDWFGPAYYMEDGNDGADVALQKIMEHTLIESDDDE
jgi:hypothetical protein